MKTDIQKVKSRTWQLLLNLLVWLGLSISYPSTNSSRVFTNSYYQITILAILTCFNLLLAYIRHQRVDKLTAWIINGFSIVYSIFLVFGRSYNARRNLQLVWDSHKAIILSAFSWFAMAIVINVLIRALIKRFKVDTIHYSLTLTKSVIFKSWCWTFVILTILWLPYFIISYPGIVDYDGMDQMNELFNSRAADGVFTLTNHHPIFPTLLEGFFLKIGISLFHSVNIGVLLNNLFLHLISLCGFSSLIVVVEILFSKKYGYMLTAFFGVFPVIPQWSNALDKTGYFTAFLVVFVTFLIWITVKAPSKLSLLGLVISAVCLGLTRNDGVLYIIFSLLGSLTLKHRRAICLSLLISVMLTVGFSHALVLTTHALPTEPMESIAVPIQQIYRSVIYNPFSLSQKDKKTLNTFFRYKEIRKNYDPEFADVSKLNSRWPYRKFRGTYQQKRIKYNSQTFVSKKREFWKIWWDLGMKNPKLYVEAWVAQTIYYVYPQITPSHYGWIIGPNYGNVQNTKLFSKYKLQYRNGYYPFFKKVMLLQRISEIPIINLLFITFGWFALYALSSLIIMAQKRYQYLNLILLGAAVVAVGLISPLNGFLRYYQPLMIIVPILLMIMKCKARDN